MNAVFDIEPIPVAVFHTNVLVAAGLRVALACFEVIETDTVSDFLDCVAGLPASGIAVTDFAIGMRVLDSGSIDPGRVLIVTDEYSEVSIRRAMERGVRGYLPLSASLESVARAVQLLRHDGAAIDPAALAKVAESLTCPTLSGREIEVLRLMMQGLPDKAIALRLQRTVGTAKSHVKAILAKLDAASRVEAVAVAHRRGLVRN